jgi:hypothetical protein
MSDWMPSLQIREHLRHAGVKIERERLPSCRHLRADVPPDIHHTLLPNGRAAGALGHADPIGVTLINHEISEVSTLARRLVGL